MNVRDVDTQTNAQGFGEDHVYITRWETTKKAVQFHKEPVGFLLKSIRSTELKCRTLVKGVTLCPQSHFSMTQLTSMLRETFPYLEDDQCIVAEELPCMCTCTNGSALVSVNRLLTQWLMPF